MSDHETSRRKDLLRSLWATAALWCGPWVLVVIGLFTGEAVRTALWTFGFAAAGTACLANALRCGRRHCFYTGPVYLLAALASLLYGLNVLPLGAQGWNWIAGVALIASLLACCVLEPLQGKYLHEAR